jgi:hypothetical protein
MASSDASGGGGERDVFGSLPTTRPQRRSTKRADKPEPSAAPRAPKAGRRTPAAAAPKAPVPPAGYATPRSDDRAPAGTALVTTAIQAAGELAAIGITFGGQAIKTALRRLPRP